MDTQTMQLHDKVQILIEQYTKDKARLVELEAALKDKSKDHGNFQNQIQKLQDEVKSLKQENDSLKLVITDLKKINGDLELTISSFENFAGDLNSRIDDLIPKIEKL